MMTDPTPQQLEAMHQDQDPTDDNPLPRIDSNTSKILELIQPSDQEQSDDPMLERMTEILEVMLQIAEGQNEDRTRVKAIEDRLDEHREVLRHIADSV